MHTLTSKRIKAKAFALIELVLVLGILAILISLAVPGLNSVLRASNLNRAGTLVKGSLNLARQEAVSKNKSTEVRFYKISDKGGSRWRGIQLWRVNQTQTGEQHIPINQMKLLPEGVIINENLSPLLMADPSVSGEVNTSNFGKASYTGFRFAASGSVKGNLNSSNNYITVSQNFDSGSEPVNFYTLQISPITGRVSLYRP